MTRYLTPSKIGLLVLASLYCESNVPDRSLIPILSFILSQLIPPSALSTSHGSQLANPKDLVSIEDFELSTRNHQSARPGRSLYDLFVEGLWAIDSLHAQHDFFQGLNAFLATKNDNAQEQVPPNRTLLSRNSPLGIFFRRCQLEFTRLHFDDAAKLWMGFLKFRAPSQIAWRKRHNAHQSLMFDAAMTEFDAQDISRLSLAAYGTTDANELEDTGASAEDIERLLQFDLEKLQFFGSRVPKPMQKQIRNMIMAKTSAPNLAYFVNFFDSWRAGDFSAAFENLHRYFDYTVRNRDKGFYHYALLHMAILQADFGCFDEAVAAMNETIATARENQDTSCLNFSLSWLSHLHKAYPNELKKTGYAGMLGSEKDRLAFLSEKAKETKSWNLLSSTLLSEARLALSLGGDPGLVMEYLYQSGHLNFVHHIFSNCGTHLLIESAMFARIGLNDLAEGNCQILMDCYSTKSSAEDNIRAICRRAQNEMQCGHHTEAYALLDSFDKDMLRTLKSTHYIFSCTGLIKLKQALRKHDLVAAEHILHQLQAGEWTDPDLKFQVAVLEIDYLIRLKNFSTAAKKLEFLIEEANDNQADIVQQIVLLLLKAEIFSKTGKAGKGFTIVLRAASMAYRFKLMPLLWEALGALANVLSFFGEFDHAARIMDAVIPRVLGAHDPATAAVLYSRQADAHMGLTGKTQADSRQRGVMLSKTEGFVDSAISLFEKLQDVRGQCEMLAKKTTIARVRGDMKLAEDWATKYIALYDRHFVNCEQAG